MNKIKALSRVFSANSIERMKNYPPSFAPIYHTIKDEYGEIVGSFLSDGLCLWWSGCIFINGKYKGMLNE